MAGPWTRSACFHGLKTGAERKLPLRGWGPAPLLRYPPLPGVAGVR